MYRSAASGETPRGRPLSLSALTQSKHSKGNIKYEPDIVISRDIIGGAGLVGPAEGRAGEESGESKSTLV